MLATQANEPFTDPKWLYEIKWDRYHIIAHVRNGQATLYSREGQNYTSKYKLVANEFIGQPDMIVNGEVVVLNENGRPDFGALQNYRGSRNLVYYIFDFTLFGW